jgi:hypothetical protein
VTGVRAADREPLPGGGDAEARFAALQARLAELPAVDELGLGAEGTVVAISSVDLGRRFNEHNDLPSLDTRWLYLIFLLRRRGARLAVVTSDRVSEPEVRYYSDLAGVAAGDRSRLLLVELGDLDARPLTEKLLEHPDALARIAEFTADGQAFIAPFAGGTAERDLALALDLPVHAVDHRFARYGTKTGSRELFAELGIPTARGAERLRDVDQLAAAVARLRRASPPPASVVIKLDQGTTGAGNVVLPLARLPPPGTSAETTAIERLLSELEPSYLEDLRGSAVVEELLTGIEVRSPSVQVRIRGDGRVSVFATHEQVLGGPAGQTYTGCRFPADAAYAAQLAAHASRVGRRLAEEGAVGRLAIDFVLVREQPDRWRTYAIEINLREGGTTHPHGALALLTDGSYDTRSATFTTAGGSTRGYRATDALRNPRWRGVPIEELVDGARLDGIGYRPDRESGVVFLMLRSLPLEGRLGLVAIGTDQGHCDELFAATERLLDRLAQRFGNGARVRERHVLSAPHRVRTDRRGEDLR